MYTVHSDVLIIDTEEGIVVVKHSQVHGYKLEYDQPGKLIEVRMLIGYTGGINVKLDELSKLEAVFGVVRE